MYTGKVFYVSNYAPRLKRYSADIELKPFLISALHGGGWSASSPGHFTPASTHWIGSWMGTTAGLDAMKEIKKSLASASN
jgi:hypothetical protein